MALHQERIYTLDDIYALPDGQRAELIDGRMYMMSPPTTSHQRISYAIARRISDYIDKMKGNCEVFLAPFAVFLNQDEKNYVEPDISVICDKNKLDAKGYNGAPDWIIEVTFPSNPQNDYGIKLFKYRTAGVREYWIVNPGKNQSWCMTWRKKKNPINTLLKIAFPHASMKIYTFAFLKCWVSCSY